MAKRKSYDQMNAGELAAATAKYDQPTHGPGLPGKPLTPAQRAAHRQAAARGKRAKMGRPKIGKGAKIVPISIERGLLKQADDYAKRHQLGRSQLVAQGLRLLMHKARAS